MDRKCTRVGGGHVGVQVRRGRHCVHLGPSNVLEKVLVRVPGHSQL